jgi:hypothetical protein
MANWTKLTEYLSKIPGGYDLKSLFFDEIEVIIQGKLPPSSAKRWFWVNTPARSYSKYWRDAGWCIKERGVNLPSRQVEFVRIKGNPILARADTSTVEGGNRLSHVPTRAASEIQVPLTDDEFIKLDSLSTAKKAVEIVKKHLREK